MMRHYVCYADRTYIDVEFIEKPGPDKVIEEIRLGSFVERKSDVYGEMTEFGFREDVTGFTKDYTL